MALSNKNKVAEPAWKKNQQKNTGSKNNEQRAVENGQKIIKSLVKIKMKTDYRDVAKKGEIYETDQSKAEELVKLGRAEFIEEVLPETEIQTGIRNTVSPEEPNTNEA